MISIKDVARHAGVSIGTVSNVINRPALVSPETRARVTAAIDELGYVRSESARHLRAGRSRIMALLVLDMGNPFFVDVARGVERAAQDEALTVLEVEQMTVGSGRDAGSRLLGLAHRPTAVFCVNDLVALGVLQAMFAAGLRVPEDMSIVGYDDIEFAAAAAVPLTSVRQPA